MNFITAGHGRYGSSFMWKTVERAMLSAVFIYSGCRYGNVLLEGLWCASWQNGTRCRDGVNE